MSLVHNPCRRTPPQDALARKPIFMGVTVVGLTAVMTQLALLREMLCVFNGNELVLGVLLGNWLLLTGVGAWLGRKCDGLAQPVRRFVLMQLLAGLLPPLQILAVRALQNVFFTRGTMPGLTETFAASLFWLLPFCLVSGYMLSLACALLAREPTARGIGSAYIADTVGSLVGGGLFSFVLIHLFDHFSLLCIGAGLNFLTASWIAWQVNWRALTGVLGVLSLAVSCVLPLLDVDKISTAWQHPGQKIVFEGNSPYGRLLVTESSGQYNFIQNGLPLFSTHNLQHAEETAHYAMAQRPGAARILLLGGGISGTALEVLKYSVRELTYVELDPLILAAGRKYIPESLSDPRIKVVNGDGRLFIQQTDEKFDIVLLDLPSPSTAQLNRFYTAEFFRSVKRVLAPNGVVSFSLGQYENYISREQARLLASTHTTLQGTFSQVLPLPGGRIFWAASDGELTWDIASGLAERQIATRYVTSNYLAAMLTPDRVGEVQAGLHPAPVNQDLKPVLYYYQLLFWMSQYGFKFSLLEGVLLALMAVYVLRLRVVPLAVFASGFAASSLEVVLLLGFQILCGSLYYQLGVIVTTFMAGLATGGFLGNRMLLKRPVAVLEGGANATLDRAPAGSYHRKLAGCSVAIAALAALLPLVLSGIIQARPGSVAPVQIVISTLTFILAFFVGMQFPLAGAAAFKNAAGTGSKIFTADLAGACLGALLASTLLVPLIGVAATCWVTGGLNLLAGLLVLLKNRHEPA